MAKFLISPIFIFGIFIVIFSLHAVALALGLYERVSSFDGAHHFLGGVWAAAVFFYFLSNRPGIVDILKSKTADFFFGISAAVFAGVLWELFEFAFDLVFGPMGFPKAQPGLSDTMTDLVFDLLGGFGFTALYIKSIFVP
ncbi:MAG TPA: hypothetical protein VJB92_03715 [Candidatus Paceibacterota bacterium]